MKKTRNIIIRNLSEEQSQAIEYIKEVTGEKTATKAIFQLVSKYKELSEDKADLELRLQSVQNNILELIS